MFLRSNARHSGGTVIPHLNFSIPTAALAPIFKFSKGVFFNQLFGPTMDVAHDVPTPPKGTQH